MTNEPGLSMKLTVAVYTALLELILVLDVDGDLVPLPCLAPELDIHHSKIKQLADFCPRFSWIFCIFEITECM